MHEDCACFICANKEGADRIREVFYELCDEAGLTLNDGPEINKPHQVGPFLGMIYDITSEGRLSICLADRQVEKLKKELRTLKGGKQHEFTTLECMMGRVY